MGGLDPSGFTDCDWGALGYYVGGASSASTIVLNGRPPTMSLDDLKYLMAPLLTSGAVSVAHVTGLTPEAPDLDRALGSREPEEIISVRPGNIARTKNLYHRSPGEEVDLVVIGCPHCTVQEARRIATLLEGGRFRRPRGLPAGGAVGEAGDMVKESRGRALTRGSARGQAVVLDRSFFSHHRHPATGRV